MNLSITKLYFRHSALFNWLNLCINEFGEVVSFVAEAIGEMERFVWL